MDGRGWDESKEIKPRRTLMMTPRRLLRLWLCRVRAMSSFKSQEAWGPQITYQQVYFIFTSYFLSDKYYDFIFRQRLIISRNTYTRQLDFDIDKGSSALITTKCFKKDFQGVSIYWNLKFIRFQRDSFVLACLAQCLHLRSLSLSRNPFDQKLEVSSQQLNRSSFHLYRKTTIRPTCAPPYLSWTEANQACWLAALGIAWCDL